MVAVNPKAQQINFFGTVIGSKVGLATYEVTVFKQYERITSLSLDRLATLIGGFFGAGNGTKGSDMTIGALLAVAESLYVTAEYILRDKVLSMQLSTLAAHLSAMNEVGKQIVGIRFPALRKANELLFTYDIEKAPADQRVELREKMQKEVSDVFALLPVVRDRASYDVPLILSVGLDEEVKPGLAPVLQRYTSIFLPINTVVDVLQGAPGTMYNAAHTVHLDNSWYPSVTSITLRRQKLRARFWRPRAFLCTASTHRTGRQTRRWRS